MALRDASSPSPDIMEETTPWPAWPTRPVRPATWTYSAALSGGSPIEYTCVTLAKSRPRAVASGATRTEALWPAATPGLNPCCASPARRNRSARSIGSVPVSGSSTAIAWSPHRASRRALATSLAAGSSATNTTARGRGPTACALSAASSANASAAADLTAADFTDRSYARRSERIMRTRSRRRSPSVGASVTW